MKYKKYDLEFVMGNICLLLVFILFVYSVYYFFKGKEVTIFYSDYEIESIRVDDDAEYHIIAINLKGEVEQLHDCDNGRDIYILYENIPHPILRYEYSDKLNGKNNFSRTQYNGFPEVLLPIGYKIETFSDSF